MNSQVSCENLKNELAKAFAMFEEVKQVIKELDSRRLQSQDFFNKVKFVKQKLSELNELIEQLRDKAENKLFISLCSCFSEIPSGFGLQRLDNGKYKIVFERGRLILKNDEYSIINKLIEEIQGEDPFYSVFTIDKDCNIERLENLKISVSSFKIESRSIAELHNIRFLQDEIPGNIELPFVAVLKNVVFPKECYESVWLRNVIELNNVILPAVFREMYLLSLTKGDNLRFHNIANKKPSGLVHFSKKSMPLDEFEKIKTHFEGTGLKFEYS